MRFPVLPNGEVAIWPVSAKQRGQTRLWRLQRSNYSNTAAATLSISGATSQHELANAARLAVAVLPLKQYRADRDQRDAAGRDQQDVARSPFAGDEFEGVLSPIVQGAMSDGHNPDALCPKPQPSDDQARTEDSNR